MSFREAAPIIRERLGVLAPRCALMLGSGFGGLAEQIAAPVIIPYRDLPGFPLPTVSGHAGRLIVGHLNGVCVACLQGRAHSYEGHTPASIAVPIRALKVIGCKTLLLTNAAGSLRAAMRPGSLMMITDHINWAGVNPLTGPNDDSLGPRFADMTRAYDRVLQERLRAAAKEANITLFEGVYLMTAGPSFETPAEIRAFSILGADAVGMSTVPECLIANHCGMRVAAVSGITNLAAGMTDSSLNHEQTLAEGVLITDHLSKLLSLFVLRLQDD